MKICKLCQSGQKLLKKSHIIPEFLYKSLYDKNHRLVKFDAVERSIGIENISNPPKGEYEGGLLCQKCDSNIIGKYESNISKLLSTSKSNKLKCKKIINDTSVEFTHIENVNYTDLKLFLLSILWRASISKRASFKEVDLGPYEEKIRIQLFEGMPSGDMQIPIVVFSWRNDSNATTDIIAQPRRHKKWGTSFGTYYSIILIGYIVVYFVSANIIPKELISMRLNSNNSLSIIDLPRGKGMEYVVKYTTNF